MANDMTQRRKPVDTESMTRLIAKVKKGDADNAAEIENLKAKGLIVANGQLRFG